MTSLYGNRAAFPGVDRTNTIDASVAKPVAVVATGYNGDYKSSSDPSDYIEPNLLPSSSYSGHIQKAYDMDVPCVVLFKMDWTSVQFGTENPWNLNILKSIAFSGSNTRKIAAFIIDASRVTTEDGNVMTTDNWAKGFNYFMDAAYKATGILVWPYMNKSAYNLLTGDKEPVNVALAHWAGKEDLCSPSFSSFDGGTFAWDNLPRPLDTEKQLVLGSVEKTAFWLYCADDRVTLPGVTGHPNMWLWKGDEKSLLADLEYVKRNTTPTTPTEPTDTTPTSGSTTTSGSSTPTGDTPTDAEVEELITEVKGIRALLQSIFDLIKGFFSKFA